MMKTNTILVAIPDSECEAERLDLRILMSRGLKIEQRLKKGVNLEDEQRRYQIICDRIEYLGNFISANKKIKFVELGYEYFDQVLLIKSKLAEEAKEARLTSNFCPAGLVLEQIKQFQELANKVKILDRKDIASKITFYRQAAESKCHVLELQSLEVDEESELAISSDGLSEKFLAIPVRDEITSSIDTNSFKSLRNHINTVIADVEKKVPSGVNFSDLPHNVITEMLWEFVYSKGKPMYLPVVYADGSVAKPFPIRCLKPRLGAARGTLDKHDILHVGEISQRHHEIDSQVSIYFFRNQEISLGKTSAVSDEAAYKNAKEIFEKLRKEGVYRIALHQTGFQPAAVGFFRALTEEILSRGSSAPTLEVIPQYYFGGAYQAGKSWV